MGCLVRIGQGDAAARNGCARCWPRAAAIVAAPTFSPDGLYFLGPVYEAGWGLPAEARWAAGAAYDGLP